MCDEDTCNSKSEGVLYDLSGSACLFVTSIVVLAMKQVVFYWCESAHFADPCEHNVL